MNPQDFIAKWGSPQGIPGAAYALNEEQGAQSHFLDLCELLDVPKPGSAEDYKFEEKSFLIGSRIGYADVFKRGYFAWENKAPGKNLDAALKQLLLYALALDNPPLLVVCDRLSIRIHTQFNGHPSEVHTVSIEELEQPEKRALLRRLWTDVESFRPKITCRDITELAAKSFATLADGLRKRGNDADEVAHFLTQCLFCFFAEDVGLLPGRMFDGMVNNRLVTAKKLTQGLGDLFSIMQCGGMYGKEDVPWFNGNLFKRIQVPELTIMEVMELRNAAALNWSAIDVSIFGTLFERGLDPAKRSQLGAHYTDPATIDYIVEPVLRRPLLQKWELLAHDLRALQGKTIKKGDRHYQAAKKLFVQWLEELKAFRILDPACGSGNFLFLGLKALKDIEHKSHLDAVALGLDREADLVTGPHNMLGIELNEYAAELARVTVWIGELQWRIERGYPLKLNPVLEPLNLIEQRDALLAWDKKSGEAKEAPWPKADVVIGNPPFLGGSKKRRELGDAYFETLAFVYKDKVPSGADLVCYWFEQARKAIAKKRLAAAGFVATNSIRGGSNRKVLDAIAQSSRIFDAWSDREWVNEGAAVRVSQVCFGRHSTELRLDGKAVDAIYADLTPARTDGSSVDLTTARPLAKCAASCFMGASKKGPFNITGATAREWLSQPNPHGKSNAQVLRPLCNGIDVTRRWGDRWIVDFGTAMPEFDAMLFEAPYAYVAGAVKPLRIKNNREAYRKFWWRHAEARPGMRAALVPLPRYIVTAAVAKYRSFIWMHSAVLPDQATLAFARADDTTFGILHSRFHELWSLGLCTWLGKGNDPRYTPTTCFETFPFPAGLTPADTAHQQTETVEGGALIPALAPVESAQEAIKFAATKIAQAAKRLNDLREHWLNPPEWTHAVPEVVPLGMDASPYPDRMEPRLGISAANLKALQSRTLTALYNARPAWLGLAHAELDKAVAAAYGWVDYTPAMADSEILQRLLALNRQQQAAAG